MFIKCLGMKIRNINVKSSGYGQLNKSKVVIII